MIKNKDVSIQLLEYADNCKLDGNQKKRRKNVDYEHNALEFKWIV